jgi:predicted  nucleic acid-binding Zn-ribbon protein
VSENAKLPEKPRESLSLTRNTQPSSESSHMQDVEAQMRRALGLFGTQRRQEPERPSAPPQPRQPERFGQTGHKRRFVQDGEVPVTVLHGRREHEGPTNRLEAAETAAASEHNARERAERALVEAQAVIHDLQTKLGHAQLAQVELQESARRERENTASIRADLSDRSERLAAEYQARVAVEARLAAIEQDFAAERAARHHAEAALDEAETARESAERLLQELSPHASSASEAPRPARAARPVAATRKARVPVGAIAPVAADDAEPEPVQWWLFPAKKAKKR